MNPISMRAKVGRRYAVRLAIDPSAIRRGTALALEVQWEPKPPRRLSAQERDDYYRARNAFLAELARITGLRTIVADIDLGRVEAIAPSHDHPE